MSVPPNKKIPESAAQTKVGEYPFVRRTTDFCGFSETVHSNPEKPQDSFSSVVGHNGGYFTDEYSSSFKGLSTGHTHHSRINNGSASVNVDGNNDESNQSTKNVNTMGDSGDGVKGKRYEGETRKISGSKEGEFQTVTNGKKFVSTKGDMTQCFIGNQTRTVRGNDVTAVVGTQITMVKGEMGFNVQGGGNYDLQVDSGKLRIFSGGDWFANTEGKMELRSLGDMLANSAAKTTVKAVGKILIESDTEIELKVGGTSILITSSGITIDAAGAVNIKGSGAITTQGSSTRIQGGGKAAPRTTFR